MKRIIKSYIVLLAGVAALSMQQGCGDYFDLNTNPNLVSEPSLPSLLTTATKKTGNSSYQGGSLAAPYVQYTANPSASGAADTYQIVDYTNTWDNFYFAMADITDMKNLAITSEASEYVGVANVLLAYHLSLILDFWGDAPFSEAFSDTFMPKYDSSEQNYQRALALLDEAIAELGKTDSKIRLDAASDFIHGGDRMAWIKTAYALKARLLNKISKKSSYNPTAVLSALDNAYQSNGDDAGMNAFQTRNDWAAVAVANAGLSLGGWLSEQLIDHLNGTTYGLFDPRLPKITDPTGLSLTTDYPAWIGTVNGEGNRHNPPHNNTVHDENYISRNSPWTNDTSSLWIVTYAELKFIEAEAALAAGQPDRAYTAYLAGIRANMDKLQVAPADREAYVTHPSVSVGAGNLTKKLIFKEKYVVTYLNAEAWADVRRNNYDYEDFTLPTNAVLSNFIRRVAYPSGERTKNGPNVPAEVSLDTPLWWDQP